VISLSVFKSVKFRWWYKKRNWKKGLQGIITALFYTDRERLRKQDKKDWNLFYCILL